MSSKYAVKWSDDKGFFPKNMMSNWKEGKFLLGDHQAQRLVETISTCPVIQFEVVPIGAVHFFTGGNHTKTEASPKKVETSTKTFTL